jgi:hypothetical protein
MRQGGVSSWIGRGRGRRYSTSTDEDGTGRNGTSRRPVHRCHGCPCRDCRLRCHLAILAILAILASSLSSSSHPRALSLHAPQPRSRCISFPLSPTATTLLSTLLPTSRPQAILRPPRRSKPFPTLPPRHQTTLIPPRIAHPTAYSTPTATDHGQFCCSHHDSGICTDAPARSGAAVLRPRFEICVRARSGQGRNGRAWDRIHAAVVVTSTMMHDVKTTVCTGIARGRWSMRVSLGPRAYVNCRAFEDSLYESMEAVRSEGDGASVRLVPWGVRSRTWRLVCGLAVSLPRQQPTEGWQPCIRSRWVALSLGR